jgi:diguanylate cyclase (GGDEF)-like protein/PAS domain S-box-containing protein
VERLEGQIARLRKVERELRASRRMYREILSAEWDAIIVLEAESFRVLDANDAALDLYGYERDEFKGLGFAELAPELREAVSAEHFPQRVRHTFHTRNDGGTFPAEVAVRGFGVNGQERLCIVVRDVTEHRWAQEELSRIQAAVDDASDAVVILDLNGKAVYANRAFSHMFGHTLDSLNENGVQLLFRDDRKGQQALQAALTGQRWVDEVAMVSGQGRELTVLLRATPVRDPEGRIIDVLLLGSDITEWKKFEDHLLHQATHDDLTGLYNRRHLMARLDEAIYSARRYRFPLTISLCDIDGFKDINDTHGHGVGDSVLAAFGEIIADNSRAGDICGRYGGDEFCIILPHTPAVAAANCIERIRATLAERRFGEEGGRPFAVTATFGVAELAPAHEGQEDLLVAADRALYRAKDEGRNRIVIRPQEGD